MADKLTNQVAELREHERLLREWKKRPRKGSRMTDGQTEAQIEAERFPNRQIVVVRPPPDSPLLAIRPASNMWRWVLYDGAQILAEGVPRGSEQGAHDDAEWMFAHLLSHAQIRRETRSHKPSEIEIMSDEQLTVQEKFGTVRDLLQKAQGHIARVLPKHITPERMLLITENCVRHSPRLLDADPRSLIAAVVEASQLGLDLEPRLGQGHLVPFYDKKTRRLEVQLIPGFRGLMDLAYRSGKVGTITGAVVYEKDEYEYAEGIDPILRHVPAQTANRGEVIAAYAVAKLLTGEPIHAWLWKEEVDKIRNAAPSKDSPAWRNHFSEMAKKTAIRRLCKILPVSAVQRAVALQDHADAGMGQDLAARIEFAPTEALDVESVPADDEPSTGPPPDKGEETQSAPEAAPKAAKEPKAQSSPDAKAIAEAEERLAGADDQAAIDAILGECNARKDLKASTKKHIADAAAFWTEKMDPAEVDPVAESKSKTVRKALQGRLGKAKTLLAVEKIREETDNLFSTGGLLEADCEAVMSLIEETKATFGK